MLSKGCLTGFEDQIFGNKHYSINVESCTNKDTIYIVTGQKLE